MLAVLENNDKVLAILNKINSLDPRCISLKSITEFKHKTIHSFIVLIRQFSSHFFKGKFSSHFIHL